MNGLGGLNKSPQGVVIGLVQLQLPVVVPRRPGASDRQDRRDGWQARRNLGTMDLVVFRNTAARPVDGQHPAIMCRLDGPEVGAFSRPASSTRSGAAFPSWSSTRRQSLQFRPDHRRPWRTQTLLPQIPPWIPVEPWEPGDIRIPSLKDRKARK